MEPKNIALAALGAFGVTYLLSELAYQRGKSRALRDAVADVRSSDSARVESGLNALVKAIDTDKGNDLGTKGQVIDYGLSAVVRLFCKDCLTKHPRHLLCLALKVIQKCADEAEGRSAVASCGIVDVLLRILAELSNIQQFTAADSKLLGDVAVTLAAVTSVDARKIVLDGDVPEGSGCAVRLLRSAHLKSVLEMLNFDVRNTAYQQHLSKCFANIALLDEGVAKLRQAGALEHMLSLLDKPVVELKENALAVLREMIRKDPVVRAAVIDKSPCEYFAPFLAPQHQKHSKVVDPALQILDDLLYRGPKEKLPELAAAFERAKLFDALAGMMGKDIPRQTRDLAEEVLLSAVHVLPEGGNLVREAISSHSAAIQKRKRADQEEAMRKTKEQKQQQQFLEMMAMREMMGGGGGDDEMSAMAAMMGGMGGGGMPFMQM